MTCEHRSACCCKLGRFGGRPSLGVCMTACDIGQMIAWPTIAGATIAPHGTILEPCEGCGDGTGPDFAARMEPLQ